MSHRNSISGYTDRRYRPYRYVVKFQDLRFKKLTFCLCHFSPILESVSFKLLILEVMAVLKLLVRLRFLGWLLF